MSTFGELTAPKVEQTGPSGDADFVYVDISSIDNQTKRIVEPKRLPPEAAPSRARQRLRKGDVLVSMTRPNLNAVAIVPPDLDRAIGSTGFHVLRANDDVEPHWLYYAVQSSSFVKSMCDLVQGALYPAVRPKDIREYAISRPPLAKQREIVAELEKQFSRLDEAVANLQRVKANLKRYKASVLKAAVEGRLVEAEATRARREGRTYETGEQLLLRILDERRAKWSGRGQWKAPESPTADTTLPEGWTWASVDQLGDVGTGATPKRDKAAYWNDGDVPWVTSSVVNGDYVDEASEFVTKLALAETNLTLYPIGTLLIAMYGEGKTRGKCTELRIPACTNQALAALQLDSSIRGYLRHFLELNYEEMRKFASGGVQPNLNLSLVRAVCVPLPPLAEQNRIVAEVDRHLSIIREVEAEVDTNLQRAQALRQSVLQKAFFGEQKAESIRAVAQETASTVLVARLLAQSLEKNPNIGRTALMKMAYLAPLYAQIEAANEAHYRIAAGPANLPRLEQILKRMEVLGWFREKSALHPKTRKQIYTYEQLSNANDYKRHLSSFTEQQLTKIDQLAKQLREWTTEQCELFATVYAAWNDLLIAGREATAELVVHELHNNWHQSKERFSASQIKTEMEKIQKLGMKPTGFGMATAGQAADGLSRDLFE
jgi:type I restriction enzyme, S subunit